MKYFFISAFFLSAVAAQAQIAYWAVQPKYDQVKTDESGTLVISTKKDSTFLWNDEGRLLAKTTMQVYPFREGKAVAVMPKTNLLKGFYTQEGKFIAIEYGNVANSAPYFSSGHLLVEQDGVYRYINGKGSLLYNRCESAFPFKNGFAACREYEDGTKKKGAHYAYIAADGSPVTLAYGGKTFDGGDIDYLSSVNDEGLGVVVAKGKLFLFEAKRKALRPLCVDEADSRQATVEGRVGDFLREANSYTYALHAKADEVVVELNLSHQPTAIVRGGQRTEYKQAEKKTVGAETDYALTTTGTSSIGLALNGEELLPPQFESVRPVADDKAVVMKDGKWGLIKVDENRHFRLSVNKGIAIPPSLENIYKELHDDLGCKIPHHGNLEKWARQGVLLLNAVLTVREHQANSHKGKGWEILTDRIIELLSEREDPMVFILWGRNARNKVPLIDGSRHLVLEGQHPSPLSAYGGFFGGRYFSKANAFLEANGKAPIDWSLPEIN